MFRSSLDTKNSFAREGIKTPERIALALSVLTNSRRFTGGSDDWDRGRTTVWECFHSLIDKAFEILIPRFIQFPVGE